MDDHGGEPVPVSKLAAAAGLSVFHFSRAFRQSMGTSPYQYLLARKIERAKSFLAESNRSVAEVAASVGFSRPNHFARVFKKQTGFSPNEFRWRL
jgi:AraC family transcriptional regulator